ncbi:probable LRR receptor-like serine/threonine-protein kinase At1g56140 [Capsicum annuum]|uniref:probable LRR receptor-like serine/threonine-protein kinase At1g56140 n=1 Tax=Capsicum annuum TaxID=4072 RepID=UPI001FB19B6D|nr:probable LRR receptor-like serine/threonine-protein kinase At1g56140 [Capsicum annuum]
MMFMLALVHLTLSLHPRFNLLDFFFARRVYALDVRGEIPDELWTLTFLDNLTFGINALSGEIPKELGLLTELQSLSFGTNNFSGPLPSELEDLTKLTQIFFSGKKTILLLSYINSAGVSGLIPLTFAKLQSLDTVWASDNAFTGRIPGFIGNNWSNITALRFEGNAFEGPIPASFSNLTSLTDLDLSFNNLTGRVPDVLFNLTLLTHLFLGDNKLTGTLSTLKRQSLQTIDLSYNEISGSFPSWINGPNL